LWLHPLVDDRVQAQRTADGQQEFQRLGEPVRGLIGRPRNPKSGR
jgi:hypothetical protein